jgi:hypothetical protein
MRRRSGRDWEKEGREGREGIDDRSEVYKGREE